VTRNAKICCGIHFPVDPDGRLGDEGVDAESCRERNDGQDEYKCDDVAGAVAWWHQCRQRCAAVGTDEELSLDEFTAVRAAVHR
jgi:hypothetical protein